MSPIQPAWVPPNLEFVVDDFEKDWIYDENYFDFIHARTLAGSVKDWKWLIRKAYNHLKPNGYFEAVEIDVWAWSDDSTLKDDSPYMQYLRSLHGAGNRTGRKMKIAPNLKDWIKETGFEDVTESVYVLPLGPWPKDPKLKELGRWAYVRNPDAVDAYGLHVYTQVLGWEPDAAKIHLALVKEQLRDKSLHGYSKV